MSGELAKQLFSKAKDLLVKDPQISKLELLAAKVPGAASRAHSA